MRALLHAGRRDGAPLGAKARAKVRLVREARGSVWSWIAAGAAHATPVLRAFTLALGAAAVAVSVGRGAHTSTTAPRAQTAPVADCARSLEAPASFGACGAPAASEPETSSGDSSSGAAGGSSSG